MERKTAKNLREITDKINNSKAENKFNDVISIILEKAEQEAAKGLGFVDFSETDLPDLFENSTFRNILISKVEKELTDLGYKHKMILGTYDFEKDKMYISW